MNRRHRSLIATALTTGALALTLTACSEGADAGVERARSTAADAAPAGAAAEKKTPQGPVERGGPKTARAVATETAEGSVTGGKVTSVALESGNGTQVWKVDVMTDEPRVHHVNVDAATGALLGNRSDRMPERSRQYLEIPLAKLAAASVDRESAAATALQRAGAGFVSRISIQGTESAPRWQVRVTDGTVGHEIDVDAKNGTVAQYKKGEARSSSAEVDDQDSGDRRRPSEQEIRERSGNFGRDHYDWSQHVPR
ncbi:PepSY domain-containing protein [Streptomyces sp. NPDC002104]